MFAKSLLRCLPLLALAVACGGAGASSQPDVVGLPVSVTPLSDTARVLAGMDERAEIPGGELQRLNAQWSEFTGHQSGPMREFAALHLGKEQQDCHTLFYPFSGPDVLNAVTLFPSCNTYIMFGLEPVGAMPKLSGSEEGEKAAVLADMVHAQEFILRRNFFVTRYMQQELNTRHLKGVIPLMAAMLVRSGYEVREVRLMNVDGSPADPHPAKSPRAVSIRFGRPGKPDQQIFYANFDASNEGLRRNPAFLNYISTVHGRTITLMKAASYLLHDPSFTGMRALVEGCSQVIVQDDSGLPFSDLKSAGFDVELYGNYVSVIPVFRYRYQPDLAEAYAQDASREPLGFSWSYAVKPSERGLQIARRRAD